MSSRLWAGGVTSGVGGGGRGGGGDGTQAVGGSLCMAAEAPPTVKYV